MLVVGVADKQRESAGVAAIDVLVKLHVTSILLPACILPEPLFNLVCTHALTQ